jgi:DNA-binding transcriptional LysR family regulator
MAHIGDRRELEAFVRSIELRSFTAAARELKLTPSALSKLVTRLERNLRVRLVNRTTRRIAPTPEGELFVARCRRILAEMEDAEMEIGRSRERPRGRLRMHVGVGFAVHQVVPALARFLERNPEVQVDLIVEDRQVDIVRESIDISVRPWAPESTALIVRKLFEFERGLYASASYLKRHGIPRTPDDLARHRCMAVSSIPNNDRWSFSAPNGRRVVEMGLGASANNADCVYRLALDGVGIGRLNEFIVASAVSDGRLVQVLSDQHWPEHLGMLAIYPQERHRLPRVAAVLDFLRDTFGPRPWRAIMENRARHRTRRSKT